ncbi:MAG: hypothetical protein HY716_13590 [Planctomycetes bacterium]|nr:hypothetical protein [Planctomycetota bacterium]
MAVYYPGQKALPFDRTFFNTNLENLLKASELGESVSLKLYMIDGSILDVCQIDDLKEEFLIVRGYRNEESACDLTLQIIPYGAIYRLEIGPRSNRDQRMGFSWRHGPEPA